MSKSIKLTLGFIENLALFRFRSETVSKIENFTGVYAGPFDIGWV